VKRAVHTLLLGDQAAATKRLPFAQAKLQAMFAELGNGRRHIVRHFIIEGDSIDLWVDSRGGRIQITSALVAIGQLRAFVYFTVGEGVDQGRWELFAVADMTEVAAGRIVEPDNVITYLSADFVETAGSYVMVFNDADPGDVKVEIRYRNRTGVAVWTNEILTGEHQGGGVAAVGTGVVYVSNGTFPDTVNPLALHRNKYFCSRVNAADGADLLDVELLAYDEFAIVFDTGIDGVRPTNIAGTGALHNDFHLLGRRMANGPGPTFIPIFTNFELHLMDGDTLTSLDSVTLEVFSADPRPRRVLTDEIGTVYLLYTAASSFSLNQSLRAYDRDLTRRADLDFALPTPIAYFNQEHIAVIGEFLFIHESGTGDLHKVNRAGDIVATFAYEAGTQTFEIGVLVPVRSIPTA